MRSIVDTEVLGTRIEVDAYPVDGWQITITDIDTFDTLYDMRVIDDSLFYALSGVLYKVWEDEIEKTGDADLPYRVLEKLHISCPECDED